jgi:hypothetical protein
LDLIKFIYHCLLWVILVNLFQKLKLVFGFLHDSFSIIPDEKVSNFFIRVGGQGNSLCSILQLTLINITSLVLCLWIIDIVHQIPHFIIRVNFNQLVPLLLIRQLFSAFPCLLLFAILIELLRCVRSAIVLRDLCYFNLCKSLIKVMIV